MNIVKGLVIDTPHVDNIMSGRKTWELRSTATKQRGPVALIRKGSGQIVGLAEIVDAIGPLTDQQLSDGMDKHLRTVERMNDPAVAKYRYAWVLEGARKLRHPVPYKHPSGAVIWVNLASETAAQVLSAL